MSAGHCVQGAYDWAALIVLGVVRELAAGAVAVVVDEEELARDGRPRVTAVPCPRPRPLVRLAALHANPSIIIGARGLEKSSSTRIHAG
jgi:hypothetical protein